MDQPTVPAFTMLGAADAAACEGDSCLVPLPLQLAPINVEPDADEAAAASARAVTAALDEGASL